MRFQKRLLTVLLSIVLIIPLLSHAEEAKLTVRVLLLPKFEIGQISGDDAGEAQLLFEKYCSGGTEYTVNGLRDNQKLYYKNGVALLICGEGKVDSALSLSSVLIDPRFDFSSAYIISCGCGGGSYERAVIGDVVIATTLVDKDLGHRADPRDMADKNPKHTWFHSTSYDDMACLRLNRELALKAFQTARNITLDSSEYGRSIMSAFKKKYNVESRAPKLLIGTSVTSDTYWKGIHEHDNAVAAVIAYECPDPYTVTEMEDTAVADVIRRFGLLDRMIVIRFITNLDIFMPGSTPEQLWNADNKSDSSPVENTGSEFHVPLLNHFKVTQAIVDAILSGALHA